METLLPGQVPQRHESVQETLMSVVSARGTECSSHGSGALPQLSVLRSGVLVM